MPNNTTIASQRPVGLLTPADIGERLGLPADTVRSWARRGLIASTRFGAGGKFIGLEPGVIHELRREA